MKLYEDFMGWLSLQGHGGFGQKLFDLIANAEGENVLKIASIYPAQVELFQWWTQRGDGPREPTVVEIEIKAIELESKYR